MIKIFNLIELLFVFLFLVLPPIFGATLSDKPVISFSYGINTYIFFFIALFLFVSNKKKFQMQNGKSAVMKLSEGTKSLGFIFIASVFFQLLDMFFNLNSGAFSVVLPPSFFGWINFFTGTICAVFFEETVYRFYLPEAFVENFQAFLDFSRLKKKTQAFLEFFIETLVVLLFSLAHFYLGISAVFNAFLCGIILRRCYKKTGSVFVNIAIHSFYNFAVFAFAAVS